MDLKLKNLTLIILLAILIILGIGTMAFADEVKHTQLPSSFKDISKGDAYGLNYNDMNQTNVFCIQHNQTLKGDENREYIVKNIIKVKGSKAWEISYDDKGKVKWINEKSDVNDLKEKLQQMCSEPKKVMQMKEEAADFICGKYNWDDVAEETMKLYRRT